MGRSVGSRKLLHELCHDGVRHVDSLLLVVLPEGVLQLLPNDRADLSRHETLQRLREVILGDVVRLVLRHQGGERSQRSLQAVHVVPHAEEDLSEVQVAFETIVVPPAIEVTHPVAAESSGSRSISASVL